MAYLLPPSDDVRYGVEYGDFGEGPTEIGNATTPDEGDVQSGVSWYWMGATKTGSFVVPVTSDVRQGVGYGTGGTEFDGDLILPAPADVLYGVAYDDGMSVMGDYYPVVVAEVLAGVTYGPADGLTGMYPPTAVTQAADAAVIYGNRDGILEGIDFGPDLGGVVGTVLYDWFISSVGGNYVEPLPESVVQLLNGGTGYGVGSATEGTATLPAAADVQNVAPDYGIGGVSRDPSYPTTTETQAADIGEVNTHLGDIRASVVVLPGAEAGTMAAGGGGSIFSSPIVRAA